MNQSTGVGGTEGRKSLVSTQSTVFHNSGPASLLNKEILQIIDRPNLPTTNKSWELNLLSKAAQNLIAQSVSCGSLSWRMQQEFLPSILI